MFAKVVFAAAVVVATSAPSFAQTAAPDAAGTPTTTTRRAPGTGAGTSAGKTPASSVGGAIIGSDATDGSTANEAKGLTPKATNRSPDGK